MNSKVERKNGNGDGKIKSNLMPMPWIGPETVHLKLKNQKHS